MVEEDVLEIYMVSGALIKFGSKLHGEIA